MIPIRHAFTVLGDLSLIVAGMFDPRVLICLVPKQFRFDPAPSTQAEQDYRLKWADMLAATEERTKVLEPRFGRGIAHLDYVAMDERYTDVSPPSDFPECTCPNKQAADRDDHWLACPARAASSPEAVSVPPTPPASGHPTYSGHDPRDPYCEFDTWDDNPELMCADVRCPICSTNP